MAQFKIIASIIILFISSIILTHCEKEKHGYGYKVFNSMIYKDKMHEEKYKKTCFLNNGYPGSLFEDSVNQIKHEAILNTKKLFDDCTNTTLEKRIKTSEIMLSDKQRKCIGSNLLIGAVDLDADTGGNIGYEIGKYIARTPYLYKKNEIMRQNSREMSKKIIRKIVSDEIPNGGDDPNSPMRISAFDKDKKELGIFQNEIGKAVYYPSQGGSNYLAYFIDTCGFITRTYTLPGYTKEDNAIKYNKMWEPEISQSIIEDPSRPIWMIWKLRNTYEE
ncbi:MAG: hypothetical protein J0L55_08300 [Caulobacterales bacterium]|nr:hypothetical protein [Caulobacterales bacterium]MCA0373278.1 hypothetical protein [Pseudomonadota bacterium]